jgi:glycosyltransferase involved in cell wall biosynthesis
VIGTVAPDPVAAPEAARPAGAPGRPAPRVLTFSSIFPNTEQPLHGLFVRERIRALGRLCPVTVVAPVPWVPPGLASSPRYAAYQRVPRLSRDGSLIVHHPRFAVVPRVLKSTDAVLMAASLSRALRRLHRATPFDVIDAHWAYPDGAAAAILAAELGLPFALTVRGDDVNCFAEERGRGPWIRWALRRAAIVIALSHDLKRRVDALSGGRARAVVVPNGIDGERFRPVDRTEARRRLTLDAPGRVLLSVGRLHSSKGFDTVVDAVGRLGAQASDVHLYIVGAPDDEADARPAIAAAVARHGLEGRVHLVGPQNPEQLVDWYSAADLFCLATTREGSPNVLLEAIACGLPCVTTPVGGNPDAVRSAALGILVDPDPALMSLAIDRALRTPWDRGQIAAEGGGRSWRHVAEECHAHLSGCVSR